MKNIKKDAYYSIEKELVEFANDVIVYEKKVEEEEVEDYSADDLGRAETEAPSEPSYDERISNALEDQDEQKTQRNKTQAAMHLMLGEEKIDKNINALDSEDVLKYKYKYLTDLQDQIVDATNSHDRAKRLCTKADRARRWSRDFLDVFGLCLIISILLLLPQSDMIVSELGFTRSQVAYLLIMICVAAVAAFGYLERRQRKHKEQLEQLISNNDGYD